MMTDVHSPIVITGGAQRLGLAAALALKDAGYEVVITYRRERPLLQELQQQGIETMPADFASNDGILDFATLLRERYASLRALIHNASEWLPEGGDYSDSDVLQRMMAVHVNAPYLLNQQCGELLCRHAEIHGYADIIHITDYVVSIGSRKHIAYAASKAALDNLTLSFATKYAPFVKVNSIAPSMLMFNHDDDALYREKALKKSLLGIVPGAEEGVATMRYLLESRYMTGKTIALDGGRNLARAC